MTLFGAKYSSLWGAVLCFAECLAASLDLLSRWRRPPPSPVINNSTVSTHSVLWETRFPLAKNRLSGRKELQRKKKKKKVSEEERADVQGARGSSTYSVCSRRVVASCATEDAWGRLTELLGEIPLRLLQVGWLLPVEQTGWSSRNIFVIFDSYYDLFYLWVEVTGKH